MVRLLRVVSHCFLYCVYETERALLVCISGTKPDCSSHQKELIDRSQQQSRAPSLGCCRDSMEPHVAKQENCTLQL